MGISGLGTRQEPSFCCPLLDAGRSCPQRPSKVGGDEGGSRWWGLLVAGRPGALGGSALILLLQIKSSTSCQLSAVIKVFHKERTRAMLLSLLHPREAGISFQTCFLHSL